MGASTGQVRSQTYRETQNLGPEGIYLLTSLPRALLTKVAVDIGALVHYPR